MTRDELEAPRWLDMTALTIVVVAFAVIAWDWMTEPRDDLR